MPALTGSFTRNTAIALVSASLFHVLWLLGIVFVPSGTPGVAYKTAAPQFFTLLSGGEQTTEYRDAVALVSRNLVYMSVYFLTVIAGGAIAGWACRFFIERYHLDRRWVWLRFKPPWYYLLSGDYVGDGRFMIVADILTEINQKPVVYSGWVVGPWFDHDGDLDTIFIEHVTREWMRTGDEEAKVQVPTKLSIPSDIFAIKFSEVKNINIQYIEFQDPDNPENEVGNPAAAPIDAH